MYSRLVCVFALISGALSQSALQQACEDLNFERKAYAFGSCFVLDWDRTGEFWDWSTHCTHIPGFTARLATVESTTLGKWMTETILLNAPSPAWVALTQQDGSDEPTGSFAWVKADNYTVVPEPYVAARWTTAPTDTGNINCAEIDADGKLTEVACDATKAYVCAYDEPKIHRKFILEADGQVGSDILYSKVLLNPEPAAKRMACGTLCGKRNDCFAFSIDDTGGTCNLHKDIVLSAPTGDGAYKLYRHN